LRAYDYGYSSSTRDKEMICVENADIAGSSFLNWFFGAKANTPTCAVLPEWDGHFYLRLISVENIKYIIY
jgi:hypothetical protein